MDKKPTLDRVHGLEEILHSAAEILTDQGIILYPTDTIWGIGCDATQSSAVERIFKLKERPTSKPFVLLVADQKMAEEYVGAIHPRLDRLMQYHERPLTVVYPICRQLPSISHSQDGSVAVRIVKDEFCRQLIRKVGRPLVATSANVSDQPFPKHFGEISSTILSGVDYVVPYRQQEEEQGEPSVMVTLSPKDDLVFLRN